MNKFKVDTITIVLVILVSFIFAGGLLSVKIGVGVLPPFFLASTRLLLASIILYIFLILRKVKISLHNNDIKTFLILSILTMLHFGLVFIAAKHTTVGFMAILMSTSPLFVSILAHFLLENDRLTYQKIIGIFIALIGITLLFSNKLTNFQIFYLIGNSLILIATLCFATKTIIYKKMNYNYHPAQIIMIQSFFAGLLLLLISLLIENINEVTFSNTAIACILYLAIFPGCIGFATKIYLLKRNYASNLETLFLFSVICSVVLGCLILKEQITIYMVAGGIISLTGIIIVNTQLKKEEEKISYTRI